MKLSQKTESRNNNFAFLRFFAATLVIASHSFALYGTSFEPYLWLSGHSSFGSLALDIFFIISGFLITRSWLDNPSLATFVKKRFLRIYPALFCAVIFGALIVGPLVTAYSLRDYFHSQLTFDYIKNIFLFPIRYNLPGVFINNPAPNGVNGSLWTLPFEVVMYAAVGLFGILGIIKKKALMLLITAVLVYAHVGILGKPGYEAASFLTLSVVVIVKLAIFFAVGSLIYLYRDKIALNKFFLAICLALYLVTFRTNVGLLVSYFTLPYIVIYAAYARNERLAKFDKYGDFSYGLYVYAFPVQQTLMHFWQPHLAVWSLFSSAFLVTLFLAFLSWKLVEKPFLRLKHRKISAQIFKKIMMIFTRNEKVLEVEADE